MAEEALTLIYPRCQEPVKTKRIMEVLGAALEGVSYQTLETREELESADLRNRRILFAVSLGESGINLEWYRMLKSIRIRKDCLKGSVAGVLVDSNSEWYTKDLARHLVFSANMAGCTFIGRPLVEGTRTLYNFNVIARNLELSNREAYKIQGKDLVRRILEFRLEKNDSPRLLMLHAGNPGKSNSLALWDMVSNCLEGIATKEISLRNGEIFDCIGCPYRTCLHHGEKSTCFYGGVIVEHVYPAIIECDALLMVCANYNDALVANMAAFINRLTAPFRVHDFSRKMVFSLVVSGYSGGDLVAQQIISGINMNKSFILPAPFTLLATANAPGTVRQAEGIEEKAEAFGERLKEYLYNGIDVIY
ncbi:NAD(P)H-dependent oxidoreductase [Bacillota bacterium]